MGPVPLSVRLRRACVPVLLALLCAAGAPCEADPVRREAARNAAAALSPRALSRAVSAAERLRDALTYNIGAGHLAGWLAAALSA